MGFSLNQICIRLLRFLFIVWFGLCCVVFQSQSSAAFIKSGRVLKNKPRLALAQPGPVSIASLFQPDTNSGQTGSRPFPIRPSQFVGVWPVHFIFRPVQSFFGPFIPSFSRFSGISAGSDCLPAGSMLFCPVLTGFLAGSVLSVLTTFQPVQFGFQPIWSYFGRFSYISAGSACFSASTESFLQVHTFF